MASQGGRWQSDLELHERWQSDPELQAKLAASGLALLERDGLAVLTDGRLELAADFSPLRRRVAAGAVGRELLVRAARIKGLACPRVVDATCGLGHDALLLAAAGCEVLGFEQDPVVHALLAAALARAQGDLALAAAAERLEVRREDSVEALLSGDLRPDVVYLDPMFPERTKSAAVKKKFQLLHRLERPCGNEEQLLEAALAAGPRKVVVKRPPKAPALAGRRPSYSLTGKAVRYDVLVP